jgi:hypothetical protein
MVSLSLEEITQLKHHLADYPDALKALDVIEDCDGDIEDAALSLALKAGLEPNTHEAWLASFAKRYRHLACQAQFRQELKNNQVVGLTHCLTQETTCPLLLAAPIAIFIAKQGIDEFCHSLDHSRF